MSESQNNRRESFVADGFAAGMVVMLVMTIIQRGIGFFRGIWLCRMLDDNVVGQWSMALGFITMATPLMMLGLSGAMPRYVERYRLAGQLPKLLGRIVLGTVFGSVILLGLLVLSPQTAAWLIFRDMSCTSLVINLAIAILATLFFNFIIELVGSLRQVRTVSMMQFWQGVGFTVFGLGVLYLHGGLGELILAYAFATGIAAFPGIRILLRDWSGLPTSEAEFDAKQMWRSILPYAGALWLMNLLTNTFELADRYMILHLMSGGEEIAQAAVGQYHSGRLIPMLLTSLATMFSGVLLPYLTADWEAGNRTGVEDRLNRSLFGLAIGFTVCSALTIGGSPLFFNTLLEGRYSDGLAIQPMTFTFCIWAALVTIGQNYLWVRERGGLIGWALGVGLFVNVALNFWWVPLYGLYGAVVATLVANAVVMVGTGLALVRAGYQFNSTLVWIALMPLTLIWDWRVAIAMSIASVVLHRQAQQWAQDMLQAVRVKVPAIG